MESDTQFIFDNCVSLFIINCDIYFAVSILQIYSRLMSKILEFIRDKKIEKAIEIVYNENNVSISKMMEGYSKPRNPAIATAFAYMKIIEKWGTGIPEYSESVRNTGFQSQN